jgi:predicted PurR-regulated permease PerM
MLDFRKHKTVEVHASVVIVSILLGLVILIPIYLSAASAISTSGPTLKQIPSDASDFTNHNDRTVNVLFVNVYQNRIGNWHMTGQIHNMGNETLNFIRPQVVGLITGFTRNFHLPPRES